MRQWIGEIEILDWQSCEDNATFAAVHDSGNGKLAAGGHALQQIENGKGTEPKVVKFQLRPDRQAQR